jgi:hypothetical protein
MASLFRLLATIALLAGAATVLAPMLTALEGAATAGHAHRSVR